MQLHPIARRYRTIADQCFITFLGCISNLNIELDHPDFFHYVQATHSTLRGFLNGKLHGLIGQTMNRKTCRAFKKSALNHAIESFSKKPLLEIIVNFENFCEILHIHFQTDKKTIALKLREAVYFKKNRIIKHVLDHEDSEERNNTIYNIYLLKFETKKNRINNKINEIKEKINEANVSIANMEDLVRINKQAGRDANLGNKIRTAITERKELLKKEETLLVEQNNITKDLRKAAEKELKVFCLYLLYENSKAEKASNE
jgi:hypothetical protein